MLKSHIGFYRRGVLWSPDFIESVTEGQLFNLWIRPLRSFNNRCIACHHMHSASPEVHSLARDVLGINGYKRFVMMSFIRLYSCGTLTLTFQYPKSHIALIFGVKTRVSDMPGKMGLCNQTRQGDLTFWVIALRLSSTCTQTMTSSFQCSSTALIT